MTCNNAKAAMSVEEFLDWVHRVANYTVTQKRLIAISTGS